MRTKGAGNSFIVLILLIGGVFLFSSQVIWAYEESGFPELDEAVKALKNAQQAYDNMVKSGTATKADLAAALKNVQNAQDFVNDVKKTKRGATTEATGTAGPGGGGEEVSEETIAITFPQGPPPGRPPPGSPKERPPEHPPKPVTPPPKKGAVGLAALNIQLQPHEKVLDLPTVGGSI